MPRRASVRWWRCPPARPFRRKVPSGCCIRRLFGSWIAFDGIWSTLPFGDEEVGPPVIVDIAELRMPAGRGPPVVADVTAAGHRCRWRRARSRSRSPVLNCRSWSPIEVIITSGRPSPVMSWLAIPMPQSDTCGQSSVRSGKRVQPEHLLVAAAHVVVPVVRDAQLRLARAAPVGDQHRKRAEARARSPRVRRSCVRPGGRGRRYRRPRTGRRGRRGRRNGRWQASAGLARLPTSP